MRVVMVQRSDSGRLPIGGVMNLGTIVVHMHRTLHEVVVLFIRVQ